MGQLGRKTFDLEQQVQLLTGIVSCVNPENTHRKTAILLGDTGP